MSDYFFVEPEVAGSLGPRTVFGPLGPADVEHPQYVFEGWLLDPIVESFPCILVTTDLASRIEAAGLTGSQFRDVAVERSDQFKISMPDVELPPFKWLVGVGMPGVADLGQGPDLRLVVSRAALSLLREAGMSHALVTEFR